MSRFAKLALAAAAIVGGLGLQAQARVIQLSPMNQPNFVQYWSSNGGARLFAAHSIFFNWRPLDATHPAWNVQNIQWVQRELGNEGQLLPPPTKPADWDDSKGTWSPDIPPWQYVNYVPEPASGMIVLGALALMATTRRKI